MTAHLYKRGSTDARLTFRCPWCDVVVASPVLGVHEHRTDAYLLAACAHFACGRGVLIRVPNATPWRSLDTTDDGLLLASSCVMPPRPIGD